LTFFGINMISSLASLAAALGDQRSAVGAFGRSLTADS
jgi:hypothetical protein